MSARRILVFLLALAIVSILPSHAQIAGELSGRVLDPRGAAVSHAQVDLTNQATGTRLSTTTTSTGDYVFINLAPGAYNLTASATGFTTLARLGITVATGTTTIANLPLTVGSQQQTITVTDDAPLLQSATSNIPNQHPSHLVVAMPLNTRNFIQLATLAPGVELPPGTLLPASTEAVRGRMSIYSTASRPSARARPGGLLPPSR